MWHRVCGAAWALRATSLGTPELVGMDINRWALTEAQATWKSVGLRGKTKLRQWSNFPKRDAGCDCRRLFSKRTS